MPDDILVIGAEFDPSGLTNGLDVSATSLKRFEQIVRSTVQQFPSLDISQIAAASAAQIKVEAAAMEQLNAKVRQAIQLAGLQADANTRLIQGLTAAGEAGRRASEGNAAMARGIANLSMGTSSLGGSVRGLAAGFHESTVGGRRLETALTGVALAGAGVEGSTARIVEALVVFGGAALPVLEFAAVLGTLVAAYQLVTKHAREAAAETDKFVKKVEDLNKAARTPFAQFITGIQDTQKAIKDLSAEFGKIAGGPIPGLGGLQAPAGTMTDRQVEILKEITALQQHLVDLNQDQARSEQDAQVAAAEAAAQALAKERALQEARIAFLQQLDAAGSEASNTSLKLAKDFGDTLFKAIKKTSDAWSDFRKNTSGAQEGLLTAEEIHKEFLDKQRKAFLDIADASAGVIQTANSVGLIGDNAAQALLDVVNLADALNKISLQGAGLANVLGGIGAGLALAGSVISIGKGLFGQTATDREHDQILKENNQRLLELRTSMDQSLQGIAGAQRAQDVLKVTNVLGNVGGVGKVPGHLGPSADLEKALADASLSLEQFALIIQQQTGIQILDKEGRIVASSWETARQAMEAHTKALRDATLAEQQAEKAARARQAQEDALQASIDASNAAIALLPTLRDLKRQLEGSTDDVQKQFDDMVAQLGIVAPDFAQMFAGIDLSDPTAREAFRKKMLDAVDQLMGPGFENLDPEAKQTFLDFLKQGADILDGFNSSVQDATKSLTNMPVGINLAALEFQAQAAGSGPKTGTSFPTAGFPGGGTSGNTTVSSFTWTGDIVVQGAGKNAAEIAREVKDTLKRQSLAKTGSPDNWGV